MQLSARKGDRIRAAHSARILAPPTFARANPRPSAWQSARKVAAADQRTAVGRWHRSRTGPVLQKQLNHWVMAGSTCAGGAKARGFRALSPIYGLFCHFCRNLSVPSTPRSTPRKPFVHHARRRWEPRDVHAAHAGRTPGSWLTWTCQDPVKRRRWRARIAPVGPESSRVGRHRLVCSRGVRPSPGHCPGAPLA